MLYFNSVTGKYTGGQKDIDINLVFFKKASKKINLKTWDHALERSSGINHKSRVSYPGPGFLSILHGLRCRKSTIMD